MSSSCVYLTIFLACSSHRGVWWVMSNTGTEHCWPSAKRAVQLENSCWERFSRISAETRCQGKKTPEHCTHIKKKKSHIRSVFRLKGLSVCSSEKRHLYRYGVTRKWVNYDERFFGVSKSISNVLFQVYEYELKYDFISTYVLYWK